MYKNTPASGDDRRRFPSLLGASVVTRGGSLSRRDGLTAMLIRSAVSDATPRADKRPYDVLCLIGARAVIIHSYIHK